MDTVREGKNKTQLNVKQAAGRRTETLNWRKSLSTPLLFLATVLARDTHGREKWQTGLGGIGRNTVNVDNQLCVSTVDDHMYAVWVFGVIVFVPIKMLTTRIPIIVSKSRFWQHMIFFHLQLFFFNLGLDMFLLHWVKGGSTIGSSSLMSKFMLLLLSDHSLVFNHPLRFIPMPLSSRCYINGYIMVNGFAFM